MTISEDSARYEDAFTNTPTAIMYAYIIHHPKFMNGVMKQLVMVDPQGVRGRGEIAFMLAEFFEMLTEIRPEYEIVPLSQEEHNRVHWDEVVNEIVLRNLGWIRKTDMEIRKRNGLTPRDYRLPPRD